MGPQLGYYYPEIVYQMDLKGPGINTQGVSGPGPRDVLLIGRTQNYAWSLTSAGHDVRDVYAEELCEPDGCAPTRESTHYLYKGECRPFQVFNAGYLNGNPVVYNRSVHGAGVRDRHRRRQAVRLVAQAIDVRRDGTEPRRPEGHDRGQGEDAREVLENREQVRLHLQLGVRLARTNRVFQLRPPARAGRGPRPPAPDARHRQVRVDGLPRRGEHPHAVGGNKGLLLNWNNRSAPGFMHGDDEPYGSVQRVELFDQWPKKAQITDNVGIMNRAATEDVRSPVWPVVSRGADEGPAPSARDPQVVGILDDWVSRDAPRLDADGDGIYDEAGPTIMDRPGGRSPTAVMAARFGRARTNSTPSEPEQPFRRVIRRQGSPHAYLARGCAGAST